MGNMFLGFPVSRAKIADMIVGAAPPLEHAVNHETGGDDEIDVGSLGGVLDAEQKSSWAQVSGKPGTFAPSAHHADHETGGGDEVTPIAHSPAAHHATHETGGGDEVTPIAHSPAGHKASHQNGGGDEVDVGALSGVLADEQPSSWGQVSGKPGTFAPSAHKTSHENGGGDEISLEGLHVPHHKTSHESGGDDIPSIPMAAHKASHQDGGGDELSVAALSGLLADEQDAGKVKGVIVDDSAIADGKVLTYVSASGNVEYI